VAILHLRPGIRPGIGDGYRRLSPPIDLAEWRPVVRIDASLATSFARDLLQQGLPLGDSRTGLALIVTGATVTCIHDAVAQEMGLPLVDVATMSSATHEDYECNVYAVKFEIPGTQFIFESGTVFGANLASSGLLMLIGRDTLCQCCLNYNGVDGSFTLSM